MMIVLFGENTYERDSALRKLVGSFDGELTKYDGVEVALGDLADMLMGQTLFSQKRMVVIRQLSENTTVWQKLEEWYPRISSDITVVLIEDKPDKRTTVWKFLQKKADIREFVTWTKKDIQNAVEWLLARAKLAGVSLTTAQARYLVERAGLDQHTLASTIEKLLLAGKVDRETINSVTEAKSDETAFGLLEQSLRGDLEAVQSTIAALKLTEEPYRVMALLASQIVQLAAVQTAEGSSSADIAKEIGAAPFVVTRLKKISRKLTPRHIRLAADTDHAMKTTSAGAWELVEHLLLEIATE